MRCSAVPKRRTVVSLAGGEEVRRDARDVDGFRDRPVGKGRSRHARHHVVARFATAILDVRP